MHLCWASRGVWRVRNLFAELYPCTQVGPRHLHPSHGNLYTAAYGSLHGVFAQGLQLLDIAAIGHFRYKTISVYRITLNTLQLSTFVSHNYLRNVLIYCSLNIIQYIKSIYSIAC